MIPTARPAFLSREECERVFTRSHAAAEGGGETGLFIQSAWRGHIRWGRNHISGSADVRNTDVYLRRQINGAVGRYVFNHVDDASLQSGVAYAEWLARYRPETDNLPSLAPDLPHANPKIWFDTTYQLDVEARHAAVMPLLEKARAAGLLSAGSIQVSAGGEAVLNSAGKRRYYPYTKVQYSVTVRHPEGRASGWAGVDYNDWNRIDAPGLLAIALDKCQRSLDPVQIEPGRYTAILEPQATADLFAIVMKFLDRGPNEGGGWPFSGPKGTSKIDERVLDSRITVTADVMDPDLGWVPFDSNGDPYQPATWFEQGVLKNLSYERGYAVKRLGKDYPLLNSLACRISGGPTSIAEMIATTKRGVLVTRFDRMDVIHQPSLLSTGYTRDGLWLIENGKISNAVKNFRFTESPLFVLNNVEQLGVPQRVFSPRAPMVVPPMKVRDFNFSSFTHAI